MKQIPRFGPRKFSGTAGKSLLPMPKIDPIRPNFHPDCDPWASNGWRCSKVLEVDPKIMLLSMLVKKKFLVVPSSSVDTAR
jgi:hypothetical protein